MNCSRDILIPVQKPIACLYRIKLTGPARKQWQRRDTVYCRYEPGVANRVVDEAAALLRQWASCQMPHQMSSDAFCCHIIQSLRKLRPTPSFAAILSDEQWQPSWNGLPASLQGFPAQNLPLKEGGLCKSTNEVEWISKIPSSSRQANPVSQLSVPLWDFPDAKKIEGIWIIYIVSSSNKINELSHNSSNRNRS